MPTQSDIVVAADNLTEAFGRGWTRKTLRTMRAAMHEMPSQDRPEISWSLRVLEQAGEDALRAAMPKKTEEG